MPLILGFFANELAVGAKSLEVDEVLFPGTPALPTSRLIPVLPASPETLARLLRVPKDDTRDPVVLLFVPTDEAPAIEPVLLPALDPDPVPLAAVVEPALDPAVPTTLPVLLLLVEAETEDGRENDGMGEREREDAVDIEVTVPVGVGLSNRFDVDATRPIRPGALLVTPEVFVDTGGAGFGGGGAIAAGALAMRLGARGMLEDVVGLDEGAEAVPRFQTLCTMDLAEERKPKRDVIPFFSVKFSGDEQQVMVRWR